MMVKMFYIDIKGKFNTIIDRKYKCRPKGALVKFLYNDLPYSYWIYPYDIHHKLMISNSVMLSNTAIPFLNKAKQSFVVILVTLTIINIKLYDYLDWTAMLIMFVKCIIKSGYNKLSIDYIDDFIPVLTIVKRNNKIFIHNEYIDILLDQCNQLKNHIHIEISNSSKNLNVSTPSDTPSNTPLINNTTTTTTTTTITKKRKRVLGPEDFDDE
jgi:hypothetical protein